MEALDGPTVRLRSPAAGDLIRIYEWYRDPEVVAPFDRYGTESFEQFERSIGAAATDPSSLAPRYVLEPRAGGPVVGAVGHYVPHPVLETVEVWYLIGEPIARGRGYGKEAVGLLVDRLFATGPVERIGITCDVENVPSIRLAEGLGFHREGTLRGALFHHGRWHDVAQYGLRRGERVAPGPPG
ncbi:GCN5-related N-acetyltransferase domain protein [mine drainage metagenome]|uniref:GCN5-related N-acetyltransferase domain protein n=1 Tax=mine drainage metagenome TaxID=410659 RepID=T0XY95_9ZZZZ